VFSCYLKRESGVLMAVFLWGGDGGHETTGRPYYVPCLVYRSQVDLADDNGSMHTYNSIRLGRAHIQSRIRQKSAYRASPSDQLVEKS